MREWLETDSKQSISIEMRGVYRTKATWNEVVQILCGLSNCGEIFWDDGDMMKLPINRSENKIEFRKNDEIPEIKERYEDWRLIEFGDVDYIRFEDRQTGSSICAQHSNKDGMWNIQLWEPFGTQPGTLYYKCFFRGLGVIPPDLDWDEYYTEERGILELAAQEKKEYGINLGEAKENKTHTVSTKLKSPDRYMADREASLPDRSKVLITESTPIQDYAAAIQSQP